jgi:hypothetical protein
MSQAQRAKLTAERKELYEEEHPEAVGHQVRGGPGRGNKTKPDSGFVSVDSFIAATTKAIGKGKTTVTTVHGAGNASRSWGMENENVRDRLHHRVDCLGSAALPSNESDML